MEVFGSRQDGVNKNNLVNVEIMRNNATVLKRSNTRLALVNSRSIKNKDLMLHQHLVEKEIDMCSHRDMVRSNRHRQDMV